MSPIETVEKLVVIAAALVGGLWALRRYSVERTEETALDIGLDYSSISLGVDYLVSFDISLTNRGKIKIQAKPGPFSSGFAFDDGVEKLRYSGSLQFKRWAKGVVR